MMVLYHFRPATGYVDQLMLKQITSLKQMALLDQQMTITSQTMLNHPFTILDC